MKLLTHNMLTSNIIKGVTNGYPLKILSSKIERKTVDFNKDFVIRMIPKLDWSALLQASTDVGHDHDLPEKPVEGYEDNHNFLEKVHNVMMQIEVIEGELVCPETGRKFPITSGIPNMLLNEDEV